MARVPYNGLRIGIDARLNAYRVGGIPQYTQQLVQALAPQTACNTVIPLQHYSHKQPLIKAPNAKRAVLYTPPHHRLEPWSLPIELLRHRLDLLHCPDFIAPQRSPCPTVVTIHDLAFLHYPDILDDQARRYYGQVRQTIWHTNAIIAVSQATRKDISELLGVPPERIDVVYEAAAPIFTPGAVEPSERHYIPSPALHASGYNVKAGTFGLFVSTLEPRKNLPTLLKAVRVCRDRRPDTNYFLVIAGARGWRDDDIFQTVKDLRIADALLFVDNVSQETLHWLYRACIFYANPSLYEGFGLPVLEAMACGTPSLVANTGSLPEVAGEAAILLPPLDVEAWADAIEHIWHDEAQRQTLSQKAIQQATRFSWEQAARETLAIYRRVASHAKP